MELVFVLITYLGTAKIDQSYFRSIDECLYFATRVNSNTTIPTFSKVHRGNTLLYVNQGK